MKKIVLLGASNSLVFNGLQLGLRQENITLYNLSLGGSSALSKIYTLHKQENIKIIKEADLIIVETNIVDLYEVICQNMTIEQSYRNINWLFEELFFLNIKVVDLLLFEQHFFNQHNKLANIIHSAHKQCCQKYGFNFISIHDFYINKNIHYFYLSHPDPAHQISTIMYNLGKNIAHNIENFYPPRILNMRKINPNFSICTPDMFICDKEDIILTEEKDLQHREKVYYLKNDIKLQFPHTFINYYICAIHVWNKVKYAKTNDQIRKTYSSIVIQNLKKSIVKNAAAYNYCFGFYETNFIIDKQSYIFFNYNNLPHTENSAGTLLINNKINVLNFFGVSAFLLADQNGKFDFSEEIKLIQNENITIDKEYDFTYLVPPVEDYKTAIEEYNFRMDPVKLAPLQNQIKEKNNIISVLNQEKITLQNELNSLPIQKQNLEIKNLEQDLIIKKLESKKLAKSLGIKMSIINPKITFIQANSAKARIQNHLSYKLGQTLIENSKSILGYIRMPYVLSYIKDKHKFEQKAYEEKIKENPNLALPPLETYPDYNEALKEKECFTYKLGEALMQANKNWYGGGYIKFIF
ncbi:hypothetical protein ACTFDJ_08880, partial [Campylobacter jejuni]